MTVRTRANDVKGLADIADDTVAFEHGSESLNLVLRPVGEIRDGALLDLSVLAPALAKQDGRPGAVVWHGLDVHGNPISHAIHYSKRHGTYYMGTYLATQTTKKAQIPRLCAKSEP